MERALMLGKAVSLAYASVVAMQRETSSEALPP